MDRRCSAHRSNGEPCKKQAIRGGNVCGTHGGGAPQVKRKAEERIAALVDPALTTLGYLIENGENEAVRLAAAKDALDRAGYKPVDRSKNEHDIKGGVIINLPERKASP